MMWEDCADTVKTENCRKCYKCELALVCDCLFCPERGKEDCNLCTIINDQRFEEKNRNFAPYFFKEFGDTYGDPNTMELYTKSYFFNKYKEDNKYLLGLCVGMSYGKKYGFGYASFGPNMEKTETKKWVESLERETFHEDRMKKQFFSDENSLQDAINSDSYKIGFSDGIVLGFRTNFNRILYLKKIEKQYGTDFDGKTYYKIDDFREGFKVKEGVDTEEKTKKRMSRPLGI
jgi:hypothetical protein